MPMRKQVVDPSLAQGPRDPAADSGTVAGEARRVLDWRFVVEGAPVPKARARVVKGHAFTPERTRRFERAVGVLAKAAGVPLLSCAVGVSIAAYVPDLRRRDGDNLQKAIWDGLNGVAWEDDSQVVEWRGFKVLSRDNPRVDVRIWIVDGSPFGVTIEAREERGNG
jgi:Holliday junction resolvase RusA-like endonuclease